MLPRVVTAIVVPLVLAGIFLPVFRSVQSQGRPTGSLEGIDLTPFADRDLRMMMYFACVLGLCVVVMGIGARSWRHRLVVILVGAVAAFASYVAVFAALLAG